MASIVRIYFLYVYIYGKDVAYYMGPVSTTYSSSLAHTKLIIETLQVGVWSSIEPSIGIWAACLSVIRPIYRKLWRQVKPSRAARNHYINPSSTEIVTFGTRRASMHQEQYVKYDDAEMANLGQRWLGSHVVANDEPPNKPDTSDWKGIMVKTEVRLERSES